MRRFIVSALGLLAMCTDGLSYSLRAVVVDGGGARLASSSYVCGLSFGQQAASGVLASSQHKAVLGFWHGPYAPPPGVAEEVGQSAMPMAFRLSQNAPNPFGRRTAIRYSLPKECDVALRVYNSVGRVMTTLVSGKQKPGWYAVSWDVFGVPSSKLPCGTYFCRLEAGEFRATRKMVKSE
jgi:hypothetical protein